MEQEDSLKKSIDILAEMTRKDIQRLKNCSDTKISLPMKAPTSHLLLKELSVQLSAP
jgi:hypothetical protein